MVAPQNVNSSAGIGSGGYAPGEYPDLPPPDMSAGVLGWIRTNLFSDQTNTLITLVPFGLILIASRLALSSSLAQAVVFGLLAAFLFRILARMITGTRIFENTLLTLSSLFVILTLLDLLLNFAILDAVWHGKDKSACLASPEGACWAFVRARFGQFMMGFYPDSEQWRVMLTGAILLALGIPVLFHRMPGRKWIGLALLFGFPPVAFILLHGGIFGLPTVDTSKWGGLLLTLVVAITGIAVSLPLGVLLALGRRSDMPIVRSICVVFIEFWRGVPLVTVLFMAAVMIPLFLPQGVSFDLLLRALIGVALFASAYMAEVIRGGLQALPKGQFEAGAALGLSYWKSMWLIVLPQALKIVIPGIVNTFISLFKDTTLVSIVQLFDLLGIIQSGLTSGKWIATNTPPTGYLFAAMVFFMFCFAMSRYSVGLERRLNTGHAQ